MTTFLPGLNFQVGAIVVRRRHLLRTRGTVVQIGTPLSKGTWRVWVKWDHPRTLPNPSLERSDALDGIAVTSTE